MTDSELLVKEKTAARQRRYAERRKALGHRRHSIWLLNDDALIDRVKKYVASAIKKSESGK